MASADQLEQWKAMGGKVEAPAKKGNTKKESVFIAPTGERCWGSVLLRSRALLTSCARTIPGRREAEELERCRQDPGTERQGQRA